MINVVYMRQYTGSPCHVEKVDVDALADSTHPTSSNVRGDGNNTTFKLLSHLVCLTSTLPCFSDSFASPKG